MDRKVKLYIDIINSIDLIHEFIGATNLFEEYTVDLKTKSAIERQLGIIGEAIKRIKDIDPMSLFNTGMKLSGSEIFWFMDTTSLMMVLFGQS